MATCTIRLDSIDKVLCFVNALKNSEGSYELLSGRYMVDAKSLIGIFSLDLSEPLEFHSRTNTIPDEITPFLSDYLETSPPRPTVHVSPRSKRQPSHEPTPI